MFDHLETKKGLLVALISTLLLSLGCSEPEEVEGQVTRYGILASVDQSADALSKVHFSRIDASTIQFLDETFSLPAEQGLTFGFEYNIVNNGNKHELNLEEAIIFPGQGMTNPELGYPIKVQTELYQYREDRKQLIFFTLDEPWKVLEGQWVFQVKHENAIIIEEKFIIQ